MPHRLCMVPLLQSIIDVSAASSLKATHVSDALQRGLQREVENDSSVIQPKCAV